MLPYFYGFLSAILGVVAVSWFVLAFYLALITPSNDEQGSPLYRWIDECNQKATNPDRLIPLENQDAYYLAFAWRSSTLFIRLFMGFVCGLFCLITLIFGVLVPYFSAPSEPYSYRIKDPVQRASYLLNRAKILETYEQIQDGYLTPPATLDKKGVTDPDPTAGENTDNTSKKDVQQSQSSPLMTDFEIYSVTRILNKEQIAQLRQEISREQMYSHYLAKRESEKERLAETLYLHSLPLSFQVGLLLMLILVLNILLYIALNFIILHENVRKFLLKKKTALACAKLDENIHNYVFQQERNKYLGADKSNQNSQNDFDFDNP